VLALHVDRLGRLWIGTLSSGLYVFDGDGLSHLGKGEGLADDRVYALAEGTDGRLWVGTRRGLSVVRDGRVASAPGIEALSQETILYLREDRDGVLWIGTYTDGLHWLTPSGAHQRAGKVAGLLDDTIFSALEDAPSDRLWMSSNYGLFSARRQHLLGQAQDVEMISLGKADGMVSAEANGGSQPSAWAAPDGTLWFPTVAGVVIVEPAAIAAQPPLSPPRVRLDEVLADGASVSPGGATIPPGRGELEIRYRGISPATAEEVRYRYQLDGIDLSWREVGAATSARYTNLQPGRYRFRVQAGLRGAWSKEETTGALVLQPSFTQTIWFRVLLLASLAAVAGAAYWARTRQLLARSAVLAERVRLAREIHDGLTQSLIGILIQLEAALTRWAGKPEASRDHVERARDWARHSLSEARGAVAALQQVVGSTEALAGVLQRCGDALTSGTPVRFSITSGGSAALAGGAGEALLRIGQEALTNALRHGKPRSVEIRVEAADGRARLLVRDDGAGFDPEAVSPWGTGLRGMKERAAAAGITFEVRSRPGGPTEVEAATSPARGSP